MRIPLVRSDGSHSNNFNLARLLLSLCVLISHSFALIGQHEPTVMGRTLGNLAVHGFFALSGYLVAGSFFSTTPMGFLWRRALRITPGYVAGYAFSALAVWLCSNYAGNPVQGISNGSLWTLNWEILMYAALFAFGVMGFLKRSILAPILIVFLVWMATHLHEQGNGANIIAPLVFMFLMGTFIRSANNLNVKLLGVFSASLLAALFIPIVSDFALSLMSLPHMGFGLEINTYEIRYLIYLVALPFSLIALCKFAPFSIELQNDYSYGIYVFAWPCQQIIIHLMNYNGMVLRAFPVFLFAGLFSFSLAVVLWHLIEKPCLRLKHFRIDHWISGRTSQNGVTLAAHGAGEN